MIGTNVARKRQEKGLSQLDLALAIGLKSSGLISVAELNHKNRHFITPPINRANFIS